MLDNHYIDSVTVCTAPWQSQNKDLQLISLLRTSFWIISFRVAGSAKLPREKLHQAYTSISVVSFGSSGRYIFSCLTQHCCLGLKNIDLDVVLWYLVLDTKESDIPLFLWSLGEPEISSSWQCKIHVLFRLLHFMDQDALIHAILHPFIHAILHP